MAKTFDQLRTDINAAFPDVGPSRITPADLRERMVDVVGSIQANTGLQVNDSEFGIVGDGIASDYFALVNLLTYRAEKTVVFDKQYNLGGGALTLPNSTKIIGGKFKNGKLILTTNCVLSEAVLEEVEVECSGNDTSVFSNRVISLVGDRSAAIAVRSGYKNNKVMENIVDNVTGTTNGSAYGSGILVFGTGICEALSIVSNTISNYDGPAGIMFDGDITLKDVRIDSNYIHDSRNFGIEFYNTNSNSTGVVSNNIISNIGSTRPLSVASGAGCGGIYGISGTPLFGIDIINNKVSKVLEVGIEGSYGVVSGNIISDSGNDQLNFPIADNSGIYGNSKVISSNMIYNSGNSGAIHYYDSTGVSSKSILNNVVENKYKYWQANNSFIVNDVVQTSSKVYICTFGGVTGSSEPIGSLSNILDGTITWAYVKDLNKTGVNLNSPVGVKSITIQGNIFKGVNKVLSFPSIFSDVNIYNNSVEYKSNYTLIGGSGNRLAPRFNVGSSDSKEFAKNSLFLDFSGAVPDNWQVLNGSIGKVSSVGGGRNVPKIIQTDATFRTRLKTTLNCSVNKLFIKTLIRSNDGILIKFFNAVGGAYLSEHQYTSTDESPEILGLYIELEAGVDSLLVEVSTNTPSPAASNLYVTLDYFYCQAVL
jgi:hypothetical protein